MRIVLLALCAMVVIAQPAQAEPRAYAAQADTLLRSLADADRFSGVVLVAENGKPVFRKGYGQANREWNVATTPDAEFRLGSITKQFTAAAILQLAEQGKLSLDDPISKYYPTAPAAWAPVTLKHLLTHSSGIPSYTEIHGFFTGPMSRSEMKPDQIVALTRDKPLEFTPGTRYRYDNTGYILLGMVIETVSGQPYAAYLQDHIFNPLGLRHTGFDVSETVLPKRAAGYDKLGGAVTNTPYLAMSLPYAAGSLYSNVDDLLAWDLALRSGKVISPASVSAMFTDYGFRYGYGQAIEMREGRRYWNHGGSINGFTTMLARYPDQGLTLIVLCNLTTSDPAHVADTLADFYFHPDHGAGPSGPPTAAELESYVGRYQFGGALELDVTREGRRLFAKATGGNKAELFREVGRNFFSDAGGPGYIQFAPGPKSPQVVARRGPVQAVMKRVE